MTFDPFEKLPGKFSTNDGTIDFYLRVRTFIKKNSIVVDLGAGKGEWVTTNKNLKIRKQIQFIKKDVKKLYAADIDPAVLKNKSSSKNFLIKNNKLPFKKNSIDLIISDWTFEHIENPNMFYKEINRVLKRKGILCFRTPHKYNYFALINKLVEGKSIKDILLYKAQPERGNYFKSFYKLNSIKDIKKIFSNYKFNYLLFKPDPAYFFGSKILFYFFLFIHGVLPRVFVAIIYGFLEKK